MIDYSLFKLMHRHGDVWVELKPQEPHDAAEVDPERGWLRHGRLFRCRSCDEEVMVVPSPAEEEESPVPPR
jgi:hypothetical protein